MNWDYRLLRVFPFLLELQRRLLFSAVGWEGPQSSLSIAEPKSTGMKRFKRELMKTSEERLQMLSKA